MLFYDLLLNMFSTSSHGRRITTREKYYIDWSLKTLENWVYLR